jgi:hypothetical protein
LASIFRAGDELELGINGTGIGIRGTGTEALNDSVGIRRTVK